MSRVFVKNLVQSTGVVFSTDIQYIPCRYVVYVPIIRIAILPRFILTKICTATSRYSTVLLVVLVFPSRIENFFTTSKFACHRSPKTRFGCPWSSHFVLPAYCVYKFNFLCLISQCGLDSPLPFGHFFSLRIEFHSDSLVLCKAGL
jgi:hypothetical protein